MTTFRHILVPTDFGDVAKHAADVACEIAQRFGSKVTLMHVWTIPIPVYAEGVVVPVDLVMRAAEEALAEEVKRVQGKCPKVAWVLLPGSPAGAIVEGITEHGCDLVVMGTHGRRGLPRALLGSVAERVVRTSPAPVLTVHLA